MQSQRAVLALCGIVGIGKTQLACNYVQLQSDKHPERFVFWIQGDSKEDFERTILQMYPLDTETKEITDERRSEHVNSFFTYLNGFNNDWLLVIDNLSAGNQNEVELNLHKTKSTTTSKSPHLESVQKYVRGLTRGSVLLTTDYFDIAEEYGFMQRITGLKEEDGATLLKQNIIHSSSEQGKPAIPVKTRISMY